MIDEISRNLFEDYTTGHLGCGLTFLYKRWIKQVCKYVKYDT